MPSPTPAQDHDPGATSRSFECGWWPAALVGALFLGSHLLFLARSPHDLDGVNFALGVRDFDITRHQPHPPGYPLFILLGRLAVWALGPFVSVLATRPAGLEVETLALSAWSAIAGGIAALALFDLFCSLGIGRRTALAGTALTVSFPAYFFMGVRPMSDLPGLAVSFAAAAFAVRAARMAKGDERRSKACLIASVALAALGPGVRSQTVWVAVPVVAAAWIVVARQGRAPRFWYVVAAGIAGAAAWTIPLLALSGGLGAYVSALGRQAAADFTHASMLALHASPAAVLAALRNTLVLPWAGMSLALPVLAAAAIGLFALGRRPQALAWLVALVVPYGVFHLAFHETDHVRYALPTVPVASALAAVGVERILGRAAALGWGALVLAALTVVLPPSIAQAETQAPVFEALDDLLAAMPAASEAPAVGMHESIWLASRGYELPVEPIGGDAGTEPLSVASLLEEQPNRTVWFLASARRTDLAMIDPSSRTLLGHYEWPFRPERLLSGARPLGVNWYQFRRPGWVLLRGWSLTPEIGGRTRESLEADAGLRPTALVRQTHRPVSLLIGGRFIDGSCGSTASLVITIDGEQAARYPLTSSPTFLAVHDMDPPSAQAEPRRWARVTLEIEGQDAIDCTTSAKFDQFDVRAGERSVLGLGAGWYEPEQARDTGELWRWLGETGEIRVLGAGTGVTLHLQGDMPVGVYPEPPVLSITAGEQELASTKVDGTFSIDVDIASRDLEACGGLLLIRSSQSFVPAESGESTDVRRLSLRFLNVSLGRPRSQAEVRAYDADGSSMPAHRFHVLSSSRPQALR